MHTYLLAKRSLNTISDCPNVGTFNNASVQVLNTESHKALKLANVGAGQTPSRTKPLPLI